MTLRTLTTLTAALLLPSCTEEDTIKQFDSGLTIRAFVTRAADDRCVVLISNRWRARLENCEAGK